LDKTNSSNRRRSYYGMHVKIEERENIDSYGPWSLKKNQKSLATSVESRLTIKAQIVKRDP
jgi:hypothetical protein